MWRQQKNRGRDHFHENSRGSKRGNFRNHEDHSDRVLDRNRDDFDSYNHHSERDRHLSEWDQDEPKYSQREDERYVGDGDRFVEDYRDDIPTDLRYREDRSRYDDDYRDTGDLTGITRDVFRADDYSSRIEDERERYNYDELRHVDREDREMEEDRGLVVDDWDSYRNEGPHLRDDRLDYSEEYRDERLAFRDETYLRDDRDIHRDENRQRDRDGIRPDHRRLNDRGRLLETERTFRTDDRKPLVEQKHTSRERSRHTGNKTDARNRGQAGSQGIGKNVGAQDRSGTRHRGRGSSNNRNKNIGNSQIRRHDIQRQREDGGRNEQKNVKRNDERHSSAEKSRSDQPASTRNRNSRQRDKRQTEDLSKPEKQSGGKHTESTHSGKDKNKDRDSTRSTLSSASRTERKGRDSPRSRSDSNSGVKRRSESQQSSRDRENHSRTNRQNSGHSSDNKAESSIYISFHEDDAISILADDDRFTNETRNYMEPELRTEPRKDHANESLNDETFQIHADSSATIFDDKDFVRNQTDNRKHEDAIFKAPTGGYSKQSRSRYKNRADSNRTSDRQSDRKQVRSSYDKNVAHNRKVFGKDKFSSKSFGKYRFSKRFDRKTSYRNELRNVQSSDTSKKQTGVVSVIIGRTGAVLTEDRKVTNDDKKERAKTGNDARGIGKNNRNRLGSSRITSSFRVKRKYFGKNFRSQINSNRQIPNDKESSGNDRKERFSKLRNERDRRDFEKKRSPAIEETTHTELKSANQGQQIIFIPNQDFQDGQAPFVNQFVNPELPVGTVPQVPLQFIPSNVAPEVPQGTEYVFIPFDQLGEVSDIPYNHNELNDSNTVSREIVELNEHANSNIDQNPKVLTPKETLKATTSTQSDIQQLTKAQQNRQRLRKIRERRKALERRLERRVFAKIMKETKEKIKAEAALQRTGLKSKPMIKRISPPAATIGSSHEQARRKLKQNVDNKEVDEYDNVSDLEDVTDDDNGEMGDDFRHDVKSSGQRRGTFRKPGEPRRSMRGRATSSNTGRQGSDEAWQSFDVRKVVERGSPQNASRSPVNEKRTINSNSMDSTSNLESKRNRPITPLQITVNNDQYAEEDTFNEFTNKGYGQRRGKMVKEQTSGQFIDREGREEDMHGRYQKNYTEDQSQPSQRWESTGGSRESIGQNNTGGNGKYGRGVRHQPYQRKPRFTEPVQRNSQRNQDHNVGNRNRYSPSNRGQTSNLNQNLGQTSINNFAGNQMISPYTNNQLQQKFSVPFSQQQMPQAQNQMNVGQAFPHNVQHVGFNQSGMQFNVSDPSLPPVSQGTVNISPFSMSGVGTHQDMSMPPTVASTPMSGVIMHQRNLSQHNHPAQKPLLHQQQQQHVVPVSQPVRTFSQQQQMQMGQKTVEAAPFQTNVSINQQRSQFSNLGNQPDNRSWTKRSPLFQQKPMHYQVSTQSAVNMQQQQQQSVMGSMGTFQQKHFPNNRANQGSRPGMIGQRTMSSNQAFISGHPVTVKDSYLPQTPGDALHRTENAGTEAQMTSNQNYTSRSNTSQVFGSVRGAAVPVTSVQVSNIPAGQSGVNNDGQFGTVLATNRSAKGHTQNQNTFSSNDVDEFGELLCVKCDKVFLSESVMRRHSKWHILADAGVRELRCDHCEQGFTSSVAFDAHMAEQHRGGNSWTCNRCDVSFSSRAAFVRHNQSARHNAI